MKHPIFSKKSWILFLFCAFVLNLNAQEKPFVIPELKEWKGGKGYFIPTGEARIIYTDSTLREIAEQFAQDYQKMFSVRLNVSDRKAQKGDFVLSLKKDRELGKEGYTIDIDKQVNISAPKAIGVYWATRTLLQIAEQSDNRQLPQGTIRDYPDYDMRGFVIDCGRKFIPMDYLRDMVKILSYYKMNVFHIHLNDNGFKQYFNHDWDKTYAAFRLECETFPGLTARDGYYTKQEFIHFQEEAEKQFVEIIPEIDAPAHTLAFSQYKPEIGSKEYGMDHLDLSNPETYAFMDALFEEYIGGNNPVFRGPKVHIGTDEYSNKDPNVVEQFRAFTDHYINYVEKFGKQAFVWGALTHADGKTPVKSDNVGMYAWYNGYAEPKEMVKQGYKLVSIPDGLVYIVPAAGYYYDYLNTEYLYNHWTPAHVGDVVFEEKDPAILGGMFAVWNDHVGNGISVKDIHHRVFPALQTVAAKTWNSSVSVPYALFESNRKKLSEAPNVNQLARVGKEPGLVYEANEVHCGMQLPYPEIEYNYTITFDLEAAQEKYGAELFRSSNAVFYLSDPVSGQFGFSRDGYLNTFRFRPYPQEKVHIKIAGDSVSTALFVNNRLVERLDIQKRYFNAGKDSMNYVRTLVFPLHQAGDFKSRITNLKVYNY